MLVAKVEELEEPFQAEAVAEVVGVEAVPVAAAAAAAADDNAVAMFLQDSCSVLKSAVSDIFAVVTLVYLQLIMAVGVVSALLGHVPVPEPVAAVPMKKIQAG